MVAKTKYIDGKARVEHTMSEPLHDLMHDLIAEMPNGATRTDFINAAITNFVSLDKGKIKTIVNQYKKQ